VKELNGGAVWDRCLLKASVPRRKWEDEDVGFGWKGVGSGWVGLK
jgi:hypothetical protein